jgi:hypothetical protein
MEYLVAFLFVALAMGIVYLGWRLSRALEPRLTGKGTSDVIG